ncbi:hypothetical protein WR25_05253 [Diploscapter pachys]|uniref:Fibronectin type-III domain-containing protein n=1 Tax=Diploscapter pachys TaxID=2018661 RepID=A0A2A2LSB8_9BILA|nr:hypothetical protein WR25_05253 [Diploscapter pachys]
MNKSGLYSAQILKKFNNKSGPNPRLLKIEVNALKEGPNTETYYFEIPSAPRHLDVTLTSPTSVKIAWQPPVHANGILMGYYIYHDKMSGGQDAGAAGYNKRSTTQIRDPAKTYFEMDKLEPNTEYAFRMNAFNRNGDGEFTEVRTIVTGGIAPNPPEILSLSLVRDDAPLVARIDWKPPAIRPNEGPINKYNIWYKPKGLSDSYMKMKSVEGTATSTEIQELWMGLEYDIWLGAENEEGQSGNATETLLTPVGSPDGEPQGVQYEISQGKIVVSWMPPPEDKRNGNITAYKAILTPMDSVGERIERKIDSTDSTSPQRVTFSVDAKKAYTFKIAASTMKGYGPYSPVLTINPDASG